MLLVLIVVVATIVKAASDGSSDASADPGRRAPAQEVSVSVQFTSVADVDGMIVHVTGSNPLIPAPPTTIKDT